MIDDLTVQDELAAQDALDDEATGLLQRAGAQVRAQDPQGDLCGTAPVDLPDRLEQQRLADAGAWERRRARCQ